VCLDETGTVDLDRIADLLGVERDAARVELVELCGRTPSPGR